MGQVIQGPWRPLAERAPASPICGTSQCTIIRLRPYRIRPEMAPQQPSAQPEPGKTGSDP